MEPFRFPDLPPELLHNVYEYIVGKHSDRDDLVFSTNVLWDLYLSREPNSPMDAMPICRRIYREALDIMYKQNSFLVILYTDVTDLDVSVHRKSRRYWCIDQIQKALPYKWDVSRIVHLRIGILVDYDTEYVLGQLEWTALSFFKSLQILRLFISTSVRVPRLFPPVVHTAGDRKVPKITIWYRRTMRDLVALSPAKVKVSFGPDDADLLLKYRGLNSDKCYAPDYSPPWFLGKTFEEFKVLRGTDIECYKAITQMED